MRKRPLEELEKEMKEIIDQYDVENLGPKVIDIDLIVPIGAVYEVDSPQLWFSFYFKHADKEVRILFDDDNRFISDEGEIWVELGIWEDREKSFFNHIEITPLSNLRDKNYLQSDNIFEW